MTEDLERRIGKMLTSITDASPLPPEFEELLFSTMFFRVSRKAPPRLLRSTLLAAAGGAIIFTLLVAAPRSDHGQVGGSAEGQALPNLPTSNSPRPAVASTTDTSSLTPLTPVTTAAAMTGSTSLGDSTAPTGPFEFNVETPFEGVWTASSAPKDSTVVIISLIGGAPFDVNNFCSTKYRVEAAETVDAVTFKILATDAKRPDGWSCGASGYQRYIGVRLGSALGGRRIINAYTGISVGPATLPELPVAIVQPSDSVQSLIERTGASVEELIALNHWSAGAEQPLPAGEVVFLP